MINIAEQRKKVALWWQTALGQSFIAAEQLELKKSIANFFGYHFVLFGAAAFKTCLTESPITHKVWLSPEIHPLMDSCSVITRYDKVPIDSDSIDLVYLAHALETIANPHEVLREVFRILLPEGHVIISAFNPWSLWGLWRWLTRWVYASPWDARFIAGYRLTDWLILLGFDVIQVTPYFFRPPITNANILQRLIGMEKIGRWLFPIFGGGYMVVARKRLITLTPIRPVFKEKTAEIIASGVEPAATE